VLTENQSFYGQVIGEFKPPSFLGESNLMSLTIDREISPVMRALIISKNSLSLTERCKQ
jgi:hypothetical protein